MVDGREVRIHCGVTARSSCGCLDSVFKQFIEIVTIRTILVDISGNQSVPLVSCMPISDVCVGSVCSAYGCRFSAKNTLVCFALGISKQVCYFAIFTISEGCIADRASDEACGVVISAGRCDDIAGETANTDFTAVVTANQSAD